MDTHKDAERNYSSDGSTHSSKPAKRSDKGSYKEVGVKAIYNEGDLKKAANPCISMTFVGETVTVTQNFNF